MSLCEYMIDSSDSIDDGRSPEEKIQNIQNELTWGFKYRHLKENDKKKPMKPMHSPINIPFQLCRAEMLKESKKTKPEFLKVTTEQGEGDNESAGSVTKKRDEKKAKGSESSKDKKRKLPIEKPTLLDRSVWPQNKYMDFLSIPNPKFDVEPPRKICKKKCVLEPCPPRFVQLAVPNKRKVFANWKEYEHFLPAEMLMRFEEILHTDQNLEPREARYYYKKIDREKRKEKRRKRLLEKREKLEREKDENWMNILINNLARDIVNYIQDEPLFALNYKQMLLSDGILDRLDKTKTMKKPSRKTKNQYKKTLIECSDKFAIWIDTLTRFVDVQAIESEEDIPPVSISSLGVSEEGESEGESDYDSSSDEDEDLRDEQLFETAESIWGEEGGDGGMDVVTETAEALMENLLKPGEGEDASDFDQMLQDLDDDILDQLITILGNCSDDFLASEVDDDKMPGVTYKDVLDRVKALRSGMPQEGEKSFLEQMMVNWALQNDPDNVNDKILQKIHEVAGLLGDLSGRKTPGEAGDIENKGEVEAGEEGGVAESGEKDGEGKGAVGDVAEVETGDEDGEGKGAEEEGAAGPGEIASESEGGEKVEGAVAPAEIANEGAEGKKEEDVPAEITSEGEGGEKEEEAHAEIANKGEKEEDVPAEITNEDEGGEKEKDAPVEIASEGQGGEKAAPVEIASEGQGGEKADDGADISGNEGGETGEDGVIEEDEAVKSPAPADGEGEEVEATEDGGILAGSDDGQESEGVTETTMDELMLSETEDEGAKTLTGLSDLEGEEDLGTGYEADAIGAGEGPMGEGEDADVAVLYEPAKPDIKPTDKEIDRLDGRVIKGHKPSKTFEHSPDTVCCLSLKTWAVWLLEITHNAHNWTQWMSCVIQAVRQYAAVVRGEVKDENGQVKVLKKAEWRKFISDTEESVVAWRQYSAHVKDLSQSIVDNFHDKKVNCCPKCLEDHLITNVVVAHDTLQSLTEAISCAAYWQRCLDTLVDKTCSLAQPHSGKDGDQLQVSSEESDDEANIEEVDDRAEESGESVYEIEEIENNNKS